MGLVLTSVQNLLELRDLGFFKNSNSVCEMGSQELMLKKNDLKSLFECAGIKTDLVDQYPDIDNWPNHPRCSSKNLFKTLGLNEYQSIDINSEHGAIGHDLNNPFEDVSMFNKFDLVTDFGTCSHIFNIPECYKTMHKLVKTGGLIIVQQQIMKGSGYFFLDTPILHAMAAANNYKIISTNYIVRTGTKTAEGSDHYYFIPMALPLLDVINYGKITGIDVHAVFQKQNDNDYKFPYTGSIMKDNFSSKGFGRMYTQDPLSSHYIPSSKLNIEEVSFKKIITEFFKRSKNRIKNIFFR